MATNTLDTSRFPTRAIKNIRPVTVGSMAQKMGITHFATLSCGHEVASKKGEPTGLIPCYECSKVKP